MSKTISKKKVLVIDDEKVVCDMACAMLGHLGYASLAAYDAKTGLEVFKQHHDDICGVLLDLTMPIMDGGECFAALLVLDPDVKVVICSGYDAYEIEERLAGKKLAGYLQKPYRVNALLEVVQTAWPQSV
ncbi:MAG: response regulator [Mariprofundales bacterium]